METRKNVNLTSLAISFFVLWLSTSTFGFLLSKSPVIKSSTCCCVEEGDKGKDILAASLLGITRGASDGVHLGGDSFGPSPLDPFCPGGMLRAYQSLQIF